MTNSEWYALALEQESAIRDALLKTYRRAASVGPVYNMQERCMLYADGTVNIYTFSPGSYLMAEHDNEAICVGSKEWFDVDDGADELVGSDEERIDWVVTNYGDDWVSETWYHFIYRRLGE